MIGIRRRLRKGTRETERRQPYGWLCSKPSPPEDTQAAPPGQHYNCGHMGYFKKECSNRAGGLPLGPVVSAERGHWKALSPEVKVLGDRTTCHRGPTGRKGPRVSPHGSHNTSPHPSGALGGPHGGGRGDAFSLKYRSLPFQSSSLARCRPAGTTVTRAAGKALTQYFSRL